MDEVKLQKVGERQQCAINSAIQTSITKEGQDTCVLRSWYWWHQQHQGRGQDTIFQLELNYILKKLHSPSTGGPQIQANDSVSDKPQSLVLARIRHCTKYKNKYMTSTLTDNPINMYAVYFIHKK